MEALKLKLKEKTCFAELGVWGLGLSDRLADRLADPNLGFRGSQGGDSRVFRSRLKVLNIF